MALTGSFPLLIFRASTYCLQITAGWIISPRELILVSSSVILPAADIVSQYIKSNVAWGL
jgi:hypothetical protein